MAETTKLLSAVADTTTDLLVRNVARLALAAGTPDAMALAAEVLREAARRENCPPWHAECAAAVDGVLSLGNTPHTAESVLADG